MRLFPIAAAIVVSMHLWAGSSASAQSMDDLNLQVHGYATQGFLYSSKNNWNTTQSSDGSAAWTESVVNVTAQPESKLRVGVQARYFLLGTFGNRITLDWAQADYKVNEHLGFRAGKVKTPTGLLNESQDIDPAQLWVLLPQSIYPIGSRDSQLAHYGGVLYGTAALGEALGKFEYRAFAGQRVLGPEDGSLQPFLDRGFTVPNGLTGRTFGGTLRWGTPLPGLMLGATVASGRLAGAVAIGPLQGTNDLSHFTQTFFFARYDHNKMMFAGEYSRQALLSTLQLPPYPTSLAPYDPRDFYVMGSYKFTAKLTGGLYFSSMDDHAAAIGSSRYQKDWAITGRYDFSPFLYLKLEQHAMDGTLVGYSRADNTALQPNTRMTLLKLGVSF